MSGLAFISAKTIFFSSISLYSKPTGGQCVPAILMLGLAAVRTLAAASAVPGAPPRRKTDRPRVAAAAERDEIRSEPATRCGSGVPWSLLAQISGIPSGTTKSASATIAPKSMSRVQRRM